MLVPRSEAVVRKPQSNQTWRERRVTRNRESSHVVATFTGSGKAEILEALTEDLHRRRLNIEQLNFADIRRRSFARALISGGAQDIWDFRVSCRTSLRKFQPKVLVLPNALTNTVDLVCPDAEGIVETTLKALATANIKAVWIDGGTRNVSDSIPVWWQNIVVVRDSGQAYEVLAKIVSELEISLGGHALVFPGVALNSI